MRAIVTQNAWLETSVPQIPFSLTPRTDSIETCAWVGWAGVLAASLMGASRGMDRTGDQAGHLFRGTGGDALVGHLAAAPHDDDAVAHLEHVRHAVRDQHHRDA